MEEIAKQAMTESELVSQLLTVQHLLLALGIYSVIGLLSYMKPVKNTLFTAQWSWLIAPISVGLSAFGVWVLKLTTLNTVGMQTVIVLAIAMVVTFTHEALIKHLIRLFKSVMKAKFGPKA